jgi:selenocysteine lyase/cysteine desulfurase
VSFSHFSNEDEIDFLLNALQAINRDATLSY